MIENLPVLGRTVLAVGCGSDQMQAWKDRGYEVIRLDIDPSTEPDIVASMTDMGAIGPYDVVYSSHSLEHLYPHEVPKALSEFSRVLKRGGVALVFVPDLEGVPATEDVLPGTCVSGLHLYYGDASLIEKYPYMAHHCGFIESTLRQVMEKAGFEVKTHRMNQHNLLAIGIKN